MSFIDLPVLQAPPVLKPPSSLVVRYGHLRMMGEFPYDGDTRPGCGAKVVIRTKRGTELAEVVTTTCTNERMNFVNEQYHIAFTADHFFHY